MPRKTTLLERAMAVDSVRKLRRPVEPEEIEVAIAWICDRVTLKQAAKAYKHSSPASTLHRVAVCLREARRQGQIQVAA